MKSGEEAPPKSQLLLCFSVEGLASNDFLKWPEFQLVVCWPSKKYSPKHYSHRASLGCLENSELTHIRSFKEEIWYIYIFVCSKKTIYVWCDVVVVKLLNKLYFLKMQYLKLKVPCHSPNSIKYSHISISPLVCGWRRGCVPPCCVFISPPSPKIGPTGFPPILKRWNKKKKKKG